MASLYNQSFFCYALSKCKVLAKQNSVKATVNKMIILNKETAIAVEFRGARNHRFFFSKYYFKSFEVGLCGKVMNNNIVPVLDTSFNNIRLKK